MKIWVTPSSKEPRTAEVLAEVEGNMGMVDEVAVDISYDLVAIYRNEGCSNFAKVLFACYMHMFTCIYDSFSSFSLLYMKKFIYKL